VCVSILFASFLIGLKTLYLCKENSVALPTANNKLLEIELGRMWKELVITYFKAV
jgi:hypothetical protein